jgi:hypothetical protein
MNGQLNVNDQLTAEGYKQGGLGSSAAGIRCRLVYLP